MASSPASVFSSPSRRPSAGSTRPKPKLCRRWSMDNINCKEGYVKDLRKQHQAQQVGQRDEAYPFMMSERRRGRISSLGINPTICETKPTNNTRPLSCSPPHHSKKLFFFLNMIIYILDRLIIKVMLMTFREKLNPMASEGFGPFYLVQKSGWHEIIDSNKKLKSIRVFVLTTNYLYHKFYILFASICLTID